VWGFGGVEISVNGLELEGGYIWGLRFPSKHAPLSMISQPSDMTKRTTKAFGHHTRRNEIQIKTRSPRGEVGWLGTDSQSVT